MIAIMSSINERLLALADAQVELQAGQTLFRTGDVVRKLYIVLAGEVHLVRRRPNGTAVMLQRAQAKQLLAEASLFAPRYHCDAVAEHGALLAPIDKESVLQAQRDDPRWLLDLATHLASEVQRARARAELLALRTVRERLEGWLAFHGELPARGRWIAVANEIGVTPEALYRELARHPAPAKRAIPLAR